MSETVPGSIVQRGVQTAQRTKVWPRQVSDTDAAGFFAPADNHCAALPAQCARHPVNQSLAFEQGIGFVTTKTGGFTTCQYCAQNVLLVRQSNASVAWPSAL
jgi:hypothetical protein